MPAKTIRTPTPFTSRKRGRKITHGMAGTPEYKAYYHMLSRCYNPKDLSYFNYGGIGITVCKRWRSSFNNFFKDVGRNPGRGYSLDRKNGKIGYSPENCRWATRLEQNNNKKDNIIVSFGQYRGTILEVSKKLGVNLKTVRHRIYRGWTFERAFSTPVVRKPWKNQFGTGN